MSMLDFLKGLNPLSFGSQVGTSVLDRDGPLVGVLIPFHSGLRLERFVAELTRLNMDCLNPLSFGSQVGTLEKQRKCLMQLS